MGVGHYGSPRFLPHPLRLVAHFERVLTMWLLSDDEEEFMQPSYPVREAISFCLVIGLFLGAHRLGSVGLGVESVRGVGIAVDLKGLYPLLPLEDSVRSRVRR